jgi:hypothetical protein
MARMPKPLSAEDVFPQVDSLSLQERLRLRRLSSVRPTARGFGLKLLLLVLLFERLGFPAGASDLAPAQCAHVVSNDVVVSDDERREVGYHVQPPGIIPDPGVWPYFAWSDTPLGVVRVRDGEGYLFFGSDGGCHKGCNQAIQRWGSITVSTGTFDHPLGQPSGDPNPPPSEFLLPTSANLPSTIDYVGGGPVYRVPEGEPGEGSLLIVYHAERPANPFWS